MTVSVKKSCVKPFVAPEGTLKSNLIASRNSRTNMMNTNLRMEKKKKKSGGEDLERSKFVRPL